MNKSISIDLENAYFHGLSGELPYYYQTDVLMISLQRLKQIMQLGGIFSRNILKEKGIDYLLKPKIYNEDDYVSICRREKEVASVDNQSIDIDEGQSFDEYIKNRIAIAIKPDIENKYQFREGNFERILGEQQVKNGIEMSDFLAIVVDLEKEKDIKKAVADIKKFAENIPITDINGKIIDDLIIEEEKSDDYEK